MPLLLWKIEKYVCFTLAFYPGKMVAACFHSQWRFFYLLAFPLCPFFFFFIPSEFGVLDFDSSQKLFCAYTYSIRHESLYVLKCRCTYFFNPSQAQLYKLSPPWTPRKTKTKATNLYAQRISNHNMTLTIQHIQAFGGVRIASQQTTQTDKGQLYLTTNIPETNILYKNRNLSH